MTNQNSSNQDYQNNADGAQIGGGVTKRILKWLGANITLTGSGSNTYNFPASTDTLVGRASTDTLTNKTIDGDDNTLQDIPTSAIKESAWDSWSPTLSNITLGGGGTTLARYLEVGNAVYFRIRLKFGTSPGASGSSAITLPVNVKSDYGTGGFGTDMDSVGTGLFRDVSVPSTSPTIAFPDTDKVVVAVYNGSTYVNLSTQTIQNGDILTLSGFYEKP